MKQMKKERIFCGIGASLFTIMFIVPITMINNRAVGPAFSFFIIALIVTLIFTLIGINILSGIQLGHDLYILNKKHSSSEIISFVESAFDRKWKSNPTNSPLVVSRTFSMLGGLVSGTPTVQVNLSDQGDSWKLDIWVSDYTIKNRAVKYGYKISKLRDSIDEVIDKFEVS